MKMRRFGKKAGFTYTAFVIGFVGTLITPSKEISLECYKCGPGTSDEKCKKKDLEIEHCEGLDKFCGKYYDTTGDYVKKGCTRLGDFERSNTCQPLNGSKEVGSVSEDHGITVCVCEEDLCNGSSHSGTQAISLIIAGLVAIFRLLKCVLP